tara:strand:+ start:19722 stop:19985 length:264 start_codon:yes stop_codon:yes gene_type:complete
MFNIGWQELLIISAVIVIILGPKELPNVLNIFFSVTKKIRNLASDFLNETESIINREDLEEIKTTITNKDTKNNLSKKINKNDQGKL